MGPADSAAPARREGLLLWLPLPALEAGPGRAARGGTAAIQYRLKAMVKAHRP